MKNGLHRKYWIGLAACVALFALASFLQSDRTTATAASGGYDGEQPDPVEMNGPIFVDWPQPDLALLFSGEMNGYLEPCGCVGLENQKGGLSRRHTLIKTLTEDGWSVVPLDMGGLVKRLGPQAEIKYGYAVNSLITLGYEAVTFGIRDLQLRADALIYVLSNIDLANSPMVSANVGIFGFDSGLSKPWRVVQAGGKKIGVTAVLGTSHQQAVEEINDIVYRAPAAALTETLVELTAQQCDLLVLMVHGNPQEARVLAQQFPQFDFVSTTGGAEEPPNRWYDVEGSDAKLIEVGHKGMYVVVVGIYDDPQQPVRFQRVPLDHRFADSAEMHQMMVNYQNDLKTAGLAAIGARTVRHPTGEFVGTATCADCHYSAIEVHENTPHAHATERLVELDPPRHFDPECLSCHVTGWNPQEYFPYESGYLGLKETPDMVTNGCENCHGPGAAHAAAELGEDDVDEAEIQRRRAAMRMKLVENEGNMPGQGQQLGPVVKNCLECHDQDNSPDFDFQVYWPQVEHYGLD